MRVYNTGWSLLIGLQWSSYPAGWRPGCASWFVVFALQTILPDERQPKQFIPDQRSFFQLNLGGSCMFITHRASLGFPPIKLLLLITAVMGAWGPHSQAQLHSIYICVTVWWRYSEVVQWLEPVSSPVPYYQGCLSCVSNHGDTWAALCSVWTL